jgi:hypothetical protein
VGSLVLKRAATWAAIVGVGDESAALSRLQASTPDVSERQVIRNQPGRHPKWAFVLTVRRSLTVLPTADIFRDH